MAAALVILFASGIPLCADASAPGRSTQPTRHDYGDLIVLDVYGSYYEMGRQQVQLLGDEGRRQFDFQFSEYEKHATGLGGSLLDWMLPIGAWAESIYDDSGLIDEARGFAAGIGVSGSDGLRFLMGSLPSGSTVFAATRSATRDGHAIIGRNVDWADGNGRLRPVVVRYHPDNGDLAYLSAAWALSGSAAVGVNEAGFALSLNWFPGAFQGLGGGLPKWPNRRVLQKAHNVDEGIHIFESAGYHGLAGFFTMADASGNIAMIECSNDSCAILRRSGDWFCGTNHAQTQEMTAVDSIRTPDSFRRLAAIENAVKLRAGKIDPGLAAEIIRDRSNSAFINDSVVANPMVFNAAVVQPSTRTLWHSIRRQPVAPFGEMIALSVGTGTPKPIEAANSPSASDLGRETELIGELRRAELLLDQGKVSEAERAYDAIASAKDKVLDPQRLLWARARTKWISGKLDDADALLAQINDTAPFEVRAWSFAMTGVIADWRGRRAEALSAYRKAEALLIGAPQYRLPDVAKLVKGGLTKPANTRRIPATPDLQYALKYPGTLGAMIPREATATSDR